MSETANPTPVPAGAGDDAEGQPKKGPSKVLLPLVVALMTIAGGVVGVLVIAPKLVAHREAVQAGLEAPEAGKAEPAEGEAAGPGDEKGPMFKIDNLIVNPAGSQGSRFLMVSVAVETPDAKMEENLRRKEAQIRDVVISLLEKQTMEKLSMEGIRDSLKAQLGDTITAIAATKTKLKVFLPQFVIQ